MQSTPESGSRGGYDGYKRRKGSKTHAAADPLGHPLTLHVTPASAQERDRVGIPAAAVQEATGCAVEIAFVDRGNTGEEVAAEAAAHGIRLEVVEVLPRRWVARFRRLARDHARLPDTFAGLHFLAFACPMVQDRKSVV